MMNSNPNTRDTGKYCIINVVHMMFNVHYVFFSQPLRENCSKKNKKRKEIETGFVLIKNAFGS